jgi:nitronate monooxygenase
MKTPNRLCELLGIDIPIIQAPTGSIAGPELVAAVSNAGGLGSMGLTWTPPEEAAAMVRRCRELTDRPFAVNFALAFEPVGLQAVLEAGAPVITFSWGVPGWHADTVHNAGAILGLQIGNPAARHMGSDPDFYIWQGMEAGGHVQSTTPLSKMYASECVPEIDGYGAYDEPVVAAGGIVDGRGIAEALRHGLLGVMLGTRFVATQESRAHPAYKDLLVQAGTDDTTTSLTICFDGGWPHAPHRVLRNRTLADWEDYGCPPPGRRPGEGKVVAYAASGEPILRYEDTAPREGMTGRIEEMALYAGMGVGRIRDIPPAGELVKRLWRETLEALEASGGRTGFD